MYDKLGGRKTVVWIVSFVTGLVMAAFGKLDAPTSDFIIQMAAVITAGNVGSKLATSIATRLSKPSSENLM